MKKIYILSIIVLVLLQGYFFYKIYSLEKTVKFNNTLLQDLLKTDENGITGFVKAVYQANVVITNLSEKYCNPPEKCKF